MIPPTLNGMRVVTARLSIPWRGVWICDCDLDPDDVKLFVSSGPAVLILGGVTLLGTIDPRASGAWVNKATARLVGGAGGWDQAVPAQHFNSPGGALLSSQVYAATAALVKELPPIDPTPVVWGSNDVRMVNAASQIFGDRDWYVNPLTGGVQVAPWPPSVLDPDAVITDFDATTMRVMLSSDALVYPNTTFTDSRFNGKTYTARDVEQIFSQEGSHVTAWCAAQPVAILQEAFAAAVRLYADTSHLKHFRYRYVLGADNNLALQAITPGAPDLNPVVQWDGLSGSNVVFAPSTEIVVGFTADTPPQPFVVAYSPSKTPLEIHLAASAKVSVDALSVALGGGAFAVVPAPWAAALKVALTAFAGALSGAIDPAVVAAGAALSTALGALPPNATTKVTAT